MRRDTSNAESDREVGSPVSDDEGTTAKSPKVQGSQTLVRGLDMLDKVVDGPVKLAELSSRMGPSARTNCSMR